MSTGSAGSPGPRCFRPPAETTASRHGGAVARWAHPLGHSPTPCRIRMIVTRRAVIPMPIMPAEAGTWKLFQQPSVRRRPHHRPYRVTAAEPRMPPVAHPARTVSGGTRCYNSATCRRLHLAAFQERTSMKAGFIGVGNMGNPMAANMIKAGHELTVHDLRRDVRHQPAGTGRPVVRHPRRAASPATTRCSRLCPCPATSKPW